MSSTTQRQNYTFFHSLRVRWAEVDPQGIAFNGSYLTYLGIATTEYYRQLGMSYLANLLRDGDGLFAVKSTLEYCAPVHSDDWLDIGARAARLGRSSLVFELGIWHDEQLFTVGELVYVYADVNERQSQPIPDWLREKIRALERQSPVEPGTHAE